MTLKTTVLHRRASRMVSATDRAAKLGLIGAIVSMAFSGALIAAPAAMSLAHGTAGQLRHLAVEKKKPAASVKPRCPPMFTAKCNKYQRVVCVQNDSRGCCTKSICR